jgi:hypothetical protein
MNRWFDPRRQLIYCPAYRLTEVVQFPPIQSPIKRSTYIRAVEPEFDVILLVDHGVLDKSERGAHRHRIGGEGTLIIVKRTLTVPKAA